VPDEWQSSRGDATKIMDIKASTARVREAMQLRPGGGRLVGVTLPRGMGGGKVCGRKNLGRGPIPRLGLQDKGKNTGKEKVADGGVAVTCQKSLGKVPRARLRKAAAFRRERPNPTGGRRVERMPGKGGVTGKGSSDQRQERNQQQKLGER